MIKVTKNIILLWMVIFSVACSQAEQSTVETGTRSQNIPQNFDVTDVDLESKFPSAVELFARKARDEMVDDSGKVVKLLRDDNKGSRHQKFLVKVADGQTLLFAHNIDLALRINSLQVGDEVQFRGEYNYNPKGGVVHWTHLDPQREHEAGWIKHNGITYQ